MGDTFTLPADLRATFNLQTNEQIINNSLYRYDTMANVWLKLPNLPGFRAAGALQLVGRDLHYIGGFMNNQGVDSTAHFVFNLDSQQWDTTTAAPMPMARDHASSIYLDGKIYIMGGEPMHHDFTNQRAEAWAYDVASNTWTQLPNMPIAKSHDEGGTFVLNGRIIMAGGQTNDYQPTNNVIAYDPATNTWSTLAPLPAPPAGPDRRADRKQDHRCARWDSGQTRRRTIRGSERSASEPSGRRKKLECESNREGEHRLALPFFIQPSNSVAEMKNSEPAVFSAPSVVPTNASAKSRRANRFARHSTPMPKLSDMIPQMTGTKNSSPQTTDATARS